MTKTSTAEPWRGLPTEVADVIEPELGAASVEILETIAREVPEYARPLEGSFGRGLRTGVGEALLQFVALIRDPEAGRGPGREVYRELGRGELRQGRTLDSLQSAYRVGARVAWRRVSEAGRRAGLDAAVLSRLAEAIFAYIDELSADSVEGYAEAQSEREDTRRRRRRELVELMLAGGADEGELRAAARSADWTVPRTVAAIACGEAEVERLARGMPQEALATAIEGEGCIVVPDAAGPGRRDALASAAEGVTRAALGPDLPPLDLGSSWRLARLALRSAEAGATAAGAGLVVADERLGDLLLFDGRWIAARIAARRLAPLESLTERSRRRMEETALAHLRHQGSATAMASELHVHPQTARYRVARLRELLGPQLDDPEARFELELALRLVAAPSGEGAEDGVPDR